MSAPAARTRRASHEPAPTTPTAGFGVTEHLNLDAVLQLARVSAKWLGARRLEAWSHYEAMPLPTRQLEEWRYTDVSQFKLDKVKLSLATAAAGIPDGARAMLAGREAAGTVIQVDGIIVEVTLEPELAAKGVLLLDLAAAGERHADLFEQHYGTIVPATYNKFAALNSALWQGGIFLYVPRGVRIEKPIRVVRWITESGSAVFPRTLIIAEPGSHAGFV